MKNTLLFTTLVAGLALTGCNKSTRTSTADTSTTATPSSTTPSASSTTPATTPPATTTDTLGAKVDRAGERVADASRDAAASLRAMGRDMSARMSEWRLSKADIEADVLADRPVVRTRTDTTPSANLNEDTLEKAIKGRLQSDSMLANLKFDVNANSRGEVELEGKARTTDEIARAIALALDNDSVTKVTSKVKLDQNAGR